MFSFDIYSIVSTSIINKVKTCFVFHNESIIIFSVLYKLTYGRTQNKELEKKNCEILKMNFFAKASYSSSPQIRYYSSLFIGFFDIESFKNSWKLLVLSKKVEYLCNKH